jgi:hypothetical protein
MAAGDDPVLQRLFDHLQVVVHALDPVLPQLEVEMVVGDRGQHAGLLEPHRADELEVFLVRPDPSRDFGVAVAFAKAGLDRPAVLVRVEEELALADQAAQPAQLVQEVEDVADLLQGVGRSGLLAVAEGRVRDEDRIGRPAHDHDVVEADPADVLVREELPEELGALGVLDVKVGAGLLRLEKAHLNRLLGIDTWEKKAGEWRERGPVWPAASVRRTNLYKRDLSL